MYSSGFCLLQTAKKEKREKSAKIHIFAYGDFGERALLVPKIKQINTEKNKKDLC